MSREKQIESTDWLTRGIPKEQLEREKQEAIMSAYLEKYFAELSFDFDEIAEKMVSIGYRKQSEGEWLNAGMFDDMAKCSVCGLIDHSLNEVYSRGTYNFCPNCGAKMKGGAE